MADIIRAPPSAQPKLSMVRWSVTASVIFRMMALMIQRVRNARSHASPSVAMVNTTKKSQPSRKFRIPNSAATRIALPKLFTWKPGSTSAVIHTATDRTSQDRMKLMG